MLISSMMGDEKGETRVDTVLEKYGDGLGAKHEHGVDDTTTASTSAVSASEASDPVAVVAENRTCSETSPVMEIITKRNPKYRAPSPPRWRFVKEAKKSFGYSSTAAGTVVEGKSSHELGAEYVPPEISCESKTAKEKVVGELSAPGIKYSELTKEQREVGELSVSGVKYSQFTTDRRGVGTLVVSLKCSKFEKAEREVGNLSVKEPEPEYEELYEGGIVVSHNPTVDLGKDKGSRVWANYQARTKDLKEDKEYGKDKFATYWCDENDPQWKLREVGKLQFGDNIFGEHFVGELPRRKREKILSNEGDSAVLSGAVSDVEGDTDDVPTTPPTPLDDSANPKRLMEEKESTLDSIDGAIDAGDDGSTSSKGIVDSHDSAEEASARRRKFYIAIMLLPLLVTGVIVGIVLGEEGSSADEDGTRVVSSVITLGNTTVQPSTYPSNSPSDSVLSSTNLFTDHEGGLHRPPFPSPSVNASIVDFSNNTFRPERPISLIPVPTILPSTDPTSRPIIFSPTNAPSNQPSRRPSQSPTSAPSNIPTAQPAETPTTLQPIPLPTNTPTSSPLELSSQSPSSAPSYSPVTGSPTIPFIGPCPGSFSFVSTFDYAVGAQVQSQGIVYQCIESQCDRFVLPKYSLKWQVIGSCRGTFQPTTSDPTMSPTRPPSVQPSRVPTNSPAEDVRYYSKDILYLFFSFLLGISRLFISCIPLFSLFHIGFSRLQVLLMFHLRLQPGLQQCSLQEG